MRMENRSASTFAADFANHAVGKFQLHFPNINRSIQKIMCFQSTPFIALTKSYPPQITFVSKEVSISDQQDCRWAECKLRVTAFTTRKRNIRGFVDEQT